MFTNPDFEMVSVLNIIGSTAATILLLANFYLHTSTSTFILLQILKVTS